MTNTINRDAIKNFIQLLKSDRRLKESTVSVKYPKEYEYILELTSYMLDAKFTERIFHIVNNLSARPICPTCNVNPCEWFYDYFRYKQCCSHKCFLQCPDRVKAIQKTMNERYGSNSALGNKKIKEKAVNTIKERYGVENAMQNSKVRQKQRETMKSVCGYDSNFSNPQVRERIAKKFEQKYGARNVLSKGWKRDQIIEKIIAKYGVDNERRTLISESSRLLLDDEGWLRQKIEIEKLPLYEIAAELNCDPTTISNRAKKFSISLVSQSESFLERKLHDALLLKYKKEILRHNREIITPYELDFVFPESKLAIEVCGLYWHSDKFKEKNYHENKMKLCKAAGYKLLTIYEDEIHDKIDIVVKTILNKLGKSEDKRIHARKTNICDVNKSDKKSFLNSYHIQGNDKSAFAVGLMDNCELVAIMSIQKTGNEYLISRYATKYNVVGGFSKLLNHIVQLYPNKKISTFADLRWSDGDLYSNNGFSIEHYVSISYDYVKRDKRFHKFNFRKSIMAKRFNLDPKMSERSMVESIGMNRLYDCGKIKFTLI